MKIVFLGTNGWYTTPTGNTPCILLDSKNHYLIFDAGNGMYKLDQYITEDKPVSLFISHFHIDHVSGLHTLSKFTFRQGIDIFVGPGRTKDFETLVNPPFTIGYKVREQNIKDLPLEVRLHELSEGSQEIPFPVTVQKLFHAYTDHGYRVTLDGKTIVYTGDTGVKDATQELAQNADVLIHECSYKKAPENDIWGHVDAIQAAQIAKNANVKKLILTHFDASQYSTLAMRDEVAQKAKEIFPETIAAQDDMVITM